ncbi:MAG: 50S ribosomal protein L11 methyltransferase [Bacteroidetes bacterium]|nr:50S ribosomal protein L11 methyltransferase [Bacteroidota bacterium]
MNYTCVTFVVHPPEPGSEILASALAQHAFESFVFTENGFDAFVLQSEYNEAWVLELKSEFPNLAFTHQTKSIAKQNWNEEWERNFTPVLIEPHAQIRASFHPAPAPPLMDILIEPKMSFGTGHHATTKLMTQALFEYPIKGKNVLDVGCGTGILSIAAKKLEASKVLGFDIDEWSIENARENRQLNGLAKTEIDFFQGTIQKIEGSLFDVVLANINRNILLKEMPQYAAALNKGGLLFLSGFFVADAPDLIAAAETCGLSFLTQNSDNEWTMLAFNK